MLVTACHRLIDLDWFVCYILVLNSISQILKKLDWCVKRKQKQNAVISKHLLTAVLRSDQVCYNMLYIILFFTKWQSSPDAYLQNDPNRCCIKLSQSFVAPFPTHLKWNKQVIKFWFVYVLHRMPLICY